MKTALSAYSNIFIQRDYSIPGVKRPLNNHVSSDAPKPVNWLYTVVDCGTVYNLYTGTIFQGSQWTVMQVVLLMQGICKGETTRELAAELGLGYKTVLVMRHKVQDSAELEQPNTPLPDCHSETDKMFQNEKKRRTSSRSKGSTPNPSE